VFVHPTIPFLIQRHGCLVIMPVLFVAFRMTDVGQSVEGEEQVKLHSLRLLTADREQQEVKQQAADLDCDAATNATECTWRLLSESSDWLLSNQGVCRMVREDGCFMELDPKALTKAKVYSLLGSSNVSTFSLALQCAHKRWCTTTIGSKRPNKAATACATRPVRGPCIFWEASIAQRVIG
jgi:hypothetical protein